MRYNNFLELNYDNMHKFYLFLMVLFFLQKMKKVFFEIQNKGVSC
jgi:hypothetical protein